MKIVFITSNPYWQRDHHRYGLDYLMKKGYEVEIWRIVSENSVLFETEAGMYKGNNYHEYSQRVFHRLVKDNKDALFYYVLTRKSYIFPIIKYGCRYMIIGGTGAVLEYPTTGNPTAVSIRDRIKRRIETGFVQSYKNLKNNTINKYNRKRYLRLLESNPPQFVITSTQYAGKVYFLDDELKKNVSYIHSMDYDRYLETRNETSSKCIVYCASGYFDRSYDEGVYRRVLPTITHRDECLEQLETLFRRLEDHYDLPVVIAGHPHTKYNRDSFGGREIVYDRLPILARNAAVFIMHTTTALSYAAIYNIPILKIVNSYFDQFGPTIWDDFSTYEFIRYEADYLNCGFLDMDDAEKMEHPWSYVKCMDEEKRKEYLEKYIIDSDKSEKLIVEYIDDLLRGAYY